MKNPLCRLLRVSTALGLVVCTLAGCEVDPMSASDAGRFDDAGSGDAPLSVRPADAALDGAQAPGCVLTDGLEEGEHRFSLEGLERRFVVRLPADYDSTRPWPVVLALHANGNDITYWDRSSGFLNIRRTLADEAVLVVVEAIDGQWRDYEMPAETWADRAESELRYLDAVISRVRSGVCVDPGALFAMGFSGGGSFAGLLACRRADIRAVAVGGAVRYFDPAECVGTPAAWITLGNLEITDARLAFRDLMRTRAGCAETSVPVEPAPCMAYENCGEGTPVHFCPHVSGHVWPDIGNDGMWAFFRTFVDP